MAVIEATAVRRGIRRGAVISTYAFESAAYSTVKAIDVIAENVARTAPKVINPRTPISKAQIAISRTIINRAMDSPVFRQQVRTWSQGTARGLVLPKPTPMRVADVVASPVTTRVLTAAVLAAGGAGIYTGVKRGIDVRRNQARIELYASAEYAYFVEEGTVKMASRPFMKPALNALPNFGDPDQLAQEALSKAKALAPVDSGTLRNSLSVNVIHNVGGTPGTVRVTYENGAARATKVIEVVGASVAGTAFRITPVERTEQGRTQVGLIAA